VTDDAPAELQEPVAAPGGASTSPLQRVRRFVPRLDATRPEAPAESTAHFRSMPGLSAPFWIALIGAIVATIVLVLAAHALFVFGIGVVLSFFLVPVVNWLERRGMGRVAASILVVAIVTAIIVVGLLIGTVILVEQGIAFLQALPGYIEDIEELYQSLTLPTWLEEGINAVATTIGSVTSNIDVGTLIIGFAQNILGLVGFFFSLLLLPFFTFYLIKDQPKMAANFFRQIPLPWKPDIEFTLHTVTFDFATYFKAELIVGAIMGVIITSGMFVIGMITGGPNGLTTFALLLGLIAFVMELLPQIGPILSYIPAAIIAITISPVALLLVSVFYFVMFNIEGSILVPTFEGGMISFSGATVLVLITIGFALAGIIGAIVALPIGAIIRDMFAHFFHKAQRESLIIESAPADDVARA
jgi:predicted PurR-regulated permease PerM